MMLHEHHGVPDHRPFEYLLNNLFGLRVFGQQFVLAKINEISKLGVTDPILGLATRKM